MGPIVVVVAKHHHRLDAVTLAPGRAGKLLPHLVGTEPASCRAAPRVACPLSMEPGELYGRTAPPRRVSVANEAFSTPRVWRKDSTTAGACHPPYMAQTTLLFHRVAGQG